MTVSMLSTSNGLRTKSLAPRRIASTAPLMVPKAVMMTTGVEISRRRISRSRSIPLIPPGILRSVSTRSTRRAARRSIASAALEARSGS